MTVKELKEKLNDFEEDRMVVIRGYEGGVNEALGIQNVMLKTNQNTAWYYGKHEVDNTGETRGVQIL